MSCHQFTPDLIDRARGIAIDPVRLRALESHLRSCRSCAVQAERQSAVSSALRRLAEEQVVPSSNERALRALLGVFDAGRTRPRRLTVGLRLSLAASILIIVGLSVGVKHEVPPGSPGEVAAMLAPPISVDSVFVVLPGATALPRLESGQVIRVEIPESELTALGLWRPAQAGPVQADVLVGQDGLARAVRLIQ